MRLIDADTLIEKMLREGDHYTNEDIGLGYHNCQHLVYDAPTVDTERHGHWVKENEEDTLFRLCVYKCSLCGGEVLSEAYLFKYCPYCGCAIKMEVEEDE